MKKKEIERLEADLAERAREEASKILAEEAKKKMDHDGSETFASRSEAKEGAQKVQSELDQKSDLGGVTVENSEQKSQPQNAGNIGVDAREAGSNEEGNNKMELRKDAVKDGGEQQQQPSPPNMAVDGDHEERKVTVIDADAFKASANEESDQKEETSDASEAKQASDVLSNSLRERAAEKTSAPGHILG